jgi:hypothetical protein
MSTAKKAAPKGHENNPAVVGEKEVVKKKSAKVLDHFFFKFMNINIF